MDNGNALIERLARMEADPRVVGRIVSAVAAVQAVAARAPTRAEALANGQANDSLPMRIRKFHNELGLHVHRLCAGALYRSRGVIALEAAGTLTSDAIRCEHVVPATVIAGLVYDRYRHAPLGDLGRFLLARAPVAAVTREEDATLLRTPRSYGEGGKVGRWVKSHPEFLPGMDASREGILPLLRYHGTAIELVYVPDGNTVDLEKMTFEEHERRIAKLPLYRGDVLFPTGADRSAA